MGFLHLALISFGGAIAWARRLLVEQKRWLSGREFADTLSLSQLIPGATTVNLAVIVGARARGMSGALTAVLGLVGLPVVISILLGAAYANSGAMPWLREPLERVLVGLGAAAAGMLVSLALKIVVPLLRGRPRSAAPFIALTFAAVGIGGTPLAWTLLLLVPPSIAVAMRSRA